MTATCCRSWAFSRCCQSGVRCPGRRRGMSSARAAFSRKRAANNGLEPSCSITSPSTSSAGSTISFGGGQRVGVGKPDRDAVVGPGGLHLDAQRLGHAPLDRHRPGRMHAAAERRQHADPPVADLVAEALDHDRAVVRQCAGGLALVVQIGGQVAGRPLVQVAEAARTRGLPHGLPQLIGPAHGIALPERHLARHTGSVRDEHPVAGDLLDPP